MLLALANAVLFILARRSAWAWRVATDDGWGTWVLRVATLVISHIPKAQLWIIDLYFQRIRGRLQAQLTTAIPVVTTHRKGWPLTSEQRGGSPAVAGTASVGSRR